MALAGSVVGEPLLTPGTLLRALWTTPWRRADVATFALARHALNRTLAAFELGGGPIFAPAYVCVEAVHALPQDHITYYPVRPDLTPDWEWLAGRARGPGALVLVHYFGFPNAIEAAQAFARAGGHLLIEDCAHSFLTTVNGRPIGTFGDAGIYSYRKLLPLPDGAGVLLGSPHRSRIGRIHPEAPAPMSAPAVARRLVKYSLVKTGVSVVGPTVAGRYAEEKHAGRARAMSVLSRRLMQALAREAERIIARRRANYRYLLNALRGFHPVHPVFPDLPDGVCPYVFPVEVPDRDASLARLRAVGIGAQTWPHLPDAVRVNPDYARAVKFSERVIVFPVHQDLGERQMEQIAGACRRIWGPSR